MTTKQFIQIAKCMGMTIQEVNDMCDAPNWPTPKQIKAEAKKLAADYDNGATDCEPLDPNMKYHNQMMDKAEFLRNL